MFKLKNKLPKPEPKLKKYFLDNNILNKLLE